MTPRNAQAVGAPEKKSKKWKLAAHRLRTRTHQRPQLWKRLPGRRGDVWLRHIPKRVRVVVIEGIKVPVIFVCTDLIQNAAQIREFYAARFSLEIAIRDLKQHVGFGDYQSATAIDRFVQFCCTAFCIWKVMMLPENAPTWLDDGTPTAINAFSFARARRGLRRFVVKQIFLNSPLTPDLKKVEEEYEPIFRIVS